MKRIALLLLLSVPPVAGRAAAPDDPPASIRRGGSNTAATVDAQDAATPLGELATGVANIGGEVRLAGSSNAEALPPDTRATDAAGPTTPVLAPRRGGSARISATSRIQPAPWYRSGLMSLVVVLAAIAGLVLLVRRLVPSMRRMTGDVVEILGRNHLSPKQSLALVRIGRRLLLVGVTPERLNTLCEIDEPQEVADLLSRAARRLNKGESFDEALSGAEAGFDRSAPRVSELTSGPSAQLQRATGQLQGLLGRLRSMQENH